MEASKDWRDVQQYYKDAKGRCCICGSTHDIGIESRFGYRVCEEHAKMTPVEIGTKRMDGK